MSPWFGVQDDRYPHGVESIAGLVSLNCYSEGVVVVPAPLAPSGLAIYRFVITRLGVDVA